ncbi:MAG TPA: hypothetical protein VGJ44_22910 [Kribbellaceae bacterium]
MCQTDYYAREQKLAIEYDGRHHLEDTKQWHRDIGRPAPAAPAA